MLTACERWILVKSHASKETLSQNPNPILQTGDVSGYGGNLQPIDNSRTVWAVFGEVNIPIVKTKGTSPSGTTATTTSAAPRIRR